MGSAEGGSGKLLSDSTASYIARKIESSEYKAGEKLPPERELAEQLKVSRTAIREAFRALQAIGLVEAHVGRGRFVTDRAAEKRSHYLVSQWFELHDSELHELSEVRALLEASSARHIPAASLPKVAEECAAGLEKAEDALRRGDMATVAALDSDFHSIPTNYSSNRPLRILTAGLIVAMGQSVRQVLSDPSQAAISLSEHRRIEDAFRQGDLELAALLINHHQNAAAQRRLVAQATGGLAVPATVPGGTT